MKSRPQEIANWIKSKKKDVVMLFLPSNKMGMVLTLRSGGEDSSHRGAGSKAQTVDSTLFVKLRRPKCGRL